MNLSDFSIFKNIHQNDLDVLLGCCDAKTKHFSKNEFVWHTGDSAKQVGIVLSGKANIIKEDVLGNRNIIGKVSDGNIFGETFACAGSDRYPVSVEMVTDGDIMLLNLSKVIRQCPTACSFHTELIKNLLAIIAQKNLNLNRKISFLSKKTTRQKIAHLLLSVMKSDMDRFVIIDFSREEMADYLGINRSALSRELGVLKEEGIIDFKRNKFSIIDVHALGRINA